ncbi:hypothetical protein GMB86_06675 [Terrilactibacillus sp. BCM23-1]|uniref:Uncharacterized protein n=1 Tax=Terrilactibacillus tamarindi TaxID=2599694 RepID=A0A6N8CUC7_9BACI|nr:hypothetical protein [Terrilactibacillus tamarindi]MTT31696.1 hypothetical protein [Terrilactibacillus tamarindi]
MVVGSTLPAPQPGQGYGVRGRRPASAYQPYQTNQTYQQNQDRQISQSSQIGQAGQTHQVTPKELANLSNLKFITRINIISLIGSSLFIIAAISNVIAATRAYRIARSDLGGQVNNFVDYPDF